MTSILRASDKSLLIPRIAIDLTQYHDNECLELFKDAAKNDKSNPSIQIRDKLFFDEFLPVYIRLDIPLSPENSDKGANQQSNGNNTTSTGTEDSVLLSPESLEKYLEYVFLSLDVTILGTVMTKPDPVNDNRNGNSGNINPSGLIKRDKSFLISAKSLKSSDIVRQISHDDRVTVIWKTVVELEHPRTPVMDSKIVINASFAISSLFSQSNFAKDLINSNSNIERPNESFKETEGHSHIESDNDSDGDSDDEILEDFKLAEISNIFDGLSTNDTNDSRVVLSTKRLYTSQQQPLELGTTVSNIRGHHGGSSARGMNNAANTSINASIRIANNDKERITTNTVNRTNELPEIPISCSMSFPIYSVVDLRLKYTRAEGINGTLFTTITLDSTSPVECIVKGLKLELSNGEVDANNNHDNHFPLILNAGESANLVYRMKVFNNNGTTTKLAPSMAGANGALPQGAGMNPNTNFNTNRDNGFIKSYAQAPIPVGIAKSGLQRLKITVDSIPILNGSAEELAETMRLIINEQTDSSNFGPNVSTMWNTQADFNALLASAPPQHPISLATSLSSSPSLPSLAKVKYPAALSNVNANNKLGYGNGYITSNANVNTNPMMNSSPVGTKSSSLSGVSLKFIGPPSVKLGEVFKWKVFVFNNSAFNKRISLMVQSNDYHQYAQQQQLKQQGSKETQHLDKSLPAPRLYPVISRATMIKNYIQPGHISGDEGLVCLNNDIRLGGILGPQCSYETDISLLALTKGIHTLYGMKIVDLITNDSYECQGMINVAVE